MGIEGGVEQYSTTNKTRGRGRELHNNDRRGKGESRPTPQKLL